MKRETPKKTCNARFIRAFQACHARKLKTGEIELSPIGHPHEMQEACEYTAAEMRHYWPGERYGTVQVMVWSN